MDPWVWLLIVAILMIVAASIGFAVTSSGAWRWIVMIVGILLLIGAIAWAIFSSSNRRMSEFMASPQGQQAMRMLLI